jgi:hypothetical protein
MGSNAVEFQIGSHLIKHGPASLVGDTGCRTYQIQQQQISKNPLMKSRTDSKQLVYQAFCLDQPFLVSKNLSQIFTFFLTKNCTVITSARMPSNQRKSIADDGSSNASAATNDPRFSKVHFDPRFIKHRKDASKLTIDQRFASMLHSDEFGSGKSTKGRKIS